MTNLTAVPPGLAPAKSFERPLPGTGELPRIEVDLDDSALVAVDSNDARSRPFNLLRTQLAKRLVESGSRIVGITSAAPGAGKSFIASNLAMALAQLPNRPIYLLDLDLRRASIASIFGIESGIGLTDYLLGKEVSLNSIGRQVGDTRLSIFPSFPGPVNSAELLVQQPFSNLMAAARAVSADSIVIVDLPPAFANDDAVIVGQQLDGILMVVEQGVTTQKQLRGVLRLLQPTPCIGTVFNRFEGGLGDPYGYGGKYDRYYSS
jgi:protein-tyrosine kinase